uniref:DNA2/NAM7 helicase-like C-terminal domain-containing protein n=1 Tax=Panagrolaimus superbus TaxID=310955 RepID=A0A914YVZ3_9BILA
MYDQQYLISSKKGHQNSTASNGTIYISSPVIVNTHPQILFHCEVPYRIVQKQVKPKCVIAVRACTSSFESKAPPVLAIKDNVTAAFDKNGTSFNELFNVGDEIFVTKYQSATSTVPRSTERIADYGENGSMFLQYHGTVLNAKRSSTLPKFREYGFITKVKTDDIAQVYMTDTKTLGEKLIDPRCVATFPPEFLKPGTRICLDYVILPSGTHLSARHDLVIVPQSLATFVPYQSITLETEMFLPIKMSIADTPTCDTLSQYFLSSVAFIESIYRDDMLEAVKASPLLWNLSKPKHAQIIYQSSMGIEMNGGFRRNYKNSLFRNGSIAILKRIDFVTGTESSPVYIRIMKASYEEHETRICFVVDATYLVRTWNLEDVEDLRNATYKIEPTDLLCHLRAFNAKLAADKHYILSRLKDSPTKHRILAAFLPIPNKYVEMNNYMKIIPSEAAEADIDRNIEIGELTCAQKTAIKASLNGEEIIVVNGGCKMGKTELMVYAIPGILQEIIEPNCYQKCLALVSSSPTLPLLVKKIERMKRYQEMIRDGGIRVLNLVNLDSTAKGSFSYIVDLMLHDSAFELNYDEKEILEKAKWSFQAKLIPQYHGNHHGPLMPDGIELNEDGNYDDDDDDELSSDDVEEDVEDEDNSNHSGSTFEEVELSDVVDDLITSTELIILQASINIIFNRYFPNFIIASNDTLISLLPSLGEHITNITVDEAGRSTALDIVTMVTECRKLEQLVLIGDKSQYPSHHRLPNNDVPKCFDNVMKRINLKASNVKNVFLNKTFNLNPELATIMRELFYPDRNISSLLQRKPLDSTVFGNPKIPILFAEMDGNDIRSYPTTRYNPQHTYVAMNAVRRVLEVDNTLKVTVLCYYEGQKLHVLNALRRYRMDQMVEVSSVEAYYGKTTDVAIVITTRNLDERKHPRRYNPVFKDGKLYLQRMPVPINEVEELGDDSCYYNFVFDEQRLLTAISRAEKATFIIGSAELLRENENWNKILNITMHESNFVKEPPQPAETVAIRKLTGKKRRRIEVSAEESPEDLYAKRRRIVIKPSNEPLQEEECEYYDDENAEQPPRKLRRMQRKERQKANRREAQQNYHRRQNQR